MEDVLLTFTYSRPPRLANRASDTMTSHPADDRLPY